MIDFRSIVPIVSKLDHKLAEQPGGWPLAAGG
jgi:hypothetical protein